MEGRKEGRVWLVVAAAAVVMERKGESEGVMGERKEVVSEN